MNKCYIVGAGDFYGEIAPDPSDFVIAADGGYNEIIQHGARCDLLIGDFDSIDAVPSGVEVLRFPVEKDDTDTFLAYREGVRRGYTDFVLLGGTGGRLDHTYANLSLLLFAKKNGHSIILEGKEERAFVIKDEKVSFIHPRGRHVSIFAVGGVAKSVTVKGLKYTLDGYDLTPEFPLTTSNLSLGSEAEVSVKNGALLIMLEK